MSDVLLCKFHLWKTLTSCKSVWVRNQLDVTLCYPLFLLYKLLNMFRATICPSSGADDCVMLSPRVGIVPWLQEGCQNRLAGSVSIEEFVATNSSMDTLAITLRSRQLLKMGTWLPETCWANYKGEIKDNTKWHLVGFLPILNYDARSTTHQINKLQVYVES